MNSEIIKIIRNEYEKKLLSINNNFLEISEYSDVGSSRQCFSYWWKSLTESLGWRVGGELVGKTWKG